MKKLILIVNLLFLAFPIYGQDTIPTAKEKESSIVYINFDGGIATGKSGGVVEIALNVIIPTNWGLSCGYSENFKTAKNLPSDYHSLWYGDPTDHLTALSLRLNKVFPTHSKKIRFGLEAGPSLIIYKELRFEKNNNSGWFNNTYNTNEDKQISIGLSLKAKVEFPLSRYFGLELAAISNINGKQSYVGIMFGISTGVLRKRS